LARVEGGTATADTSRRQDLLERRSSGVFKGRRESGLPHSLARRIGKLKIVLRLDLVERSAAQPAPPSRRSARNLCVRKRRPYLGLGRRFIGPQASPSISSWLLDCGRARRRRGRRRRRCEGAAAGFARRLVLRVSLTRNCRVYPRAFAAARGGRGVLTASPETAGDRGFFGSRICFCRSDEAGSDAKISLNRGLLDLAGASSPNPHHQRILMLLYQAKKGFAGSGGPAGISSTHA